MKLSIALLVLLSSSSSVWASDPPIRTSTQITKSGKTTYYRTNVFEHGHVSRYITRETVVGNKIKTSTTIYSRNKSR